MKLNAVFRSFAPRTSNPVDGWVCEPWGDINCDLRWYLKDFGKGSLSLAIGWSFQFVLHIDDIKSFDSNKIDNLLKNECTQIISTFDRVDRQFEHQLKVVETGNYYFNSPYDSNFDSDQLAWFAGNQTEKFVEQIINKVEKFRKNAVLTQMLYQVNEKSRIQI